MGDTLSSVISQFPISGVNEMVPDWFYFKYSDKDSGDIPIIGENFMRSSSLLTFRSWFPTIENHTQRYAMMDAIVNNRIDVVKSLLDNGFNPLQVICPERLLDSVNLASMLNRPSILNYLILRGGTLEGRDKEGNTPIMNAVKNWQFQNVKILVNSGASLEYSDYQNRDVFQKAADRNLVSVKGYLEETRAKSRTRSLGEWSISLGIEHYLSQHNMEQRILEEGGSYPFNSLTDSYLVEAVGIKSLL